MNDQTFKQEIRTELDNILNYWMTYAIDETYGGFVGKIDHDNVLYPEAPKGAVLNARILWTFSAAYDATANPEYLQLAGRAYVYITQYFIDKLGGGVFWSVDYTGALLDTKKQVYALAFVLYACCEYYRCSGNQEARETAIDLYHVIQQHSYDEINGGYFEAFAKDWQPLADLRLSAKDANEKKTMNTHLHVLEAYTNLYRIWPDAELAAHQRGLVNDFLSHIINPENGHLNLFFDEEWNVKGDTVSYGHDIEASWLLLEAAEVLKDEKLISKCKAVAIRMADAVKEGLDTDGGLWYEYEPSTHQLVKQKHWWPQAEAMVGFVNAWQVSRESKYLRHALDSWQFVKEHILDLNKGEWVWGVNEDYSIMKTEDKVGIWKCPYHNSRACLEIMKRLD